MIRLFRKIRHQLLSEEKYSVYILYASGEIILVVIGILLALQIDNWNETRKQQQQALVFKQALAADLVKDTLLIRKHLDLLVQDTTQLYSFVNRMSGDQVNLDTLIQIARFEYNPWPYVMVNFNNNTFSSLRSTGNLSLFDPWLQKDLLELNELHQAFKSSMETDVPSFLDQLMFHNQKYPFNDHGHIDPNSKLSDLIWGEVHLRELAIDLNAIVALKFVTDLPAISQLSEILVKSNEILQKLDASLGDPADH